MADTSKDMLSIKNVLLSTQGATGEMLFCGLSHALQDRPEERHEMQAGLLKMLRQVLSAAQSSAKVEAEETCRCKVDAAEAELKVRKAASATATQLLADMQTAAAAQKEKLENCRSQLTSEDEEHKRMEVVDDEKAKEVAVNMQSKNEVAGLLEAMAQQGQGEEILKFLRTIDAEPTLVAALRSVLEKEPSERTGFDSVAVLHLQEALEKKVGEWEAKIEVMASAKANIHAEALGAWAIKQVAEEHVQEAISELEAAEAAVVLAQQQLKEATDAEQHEESILNHYLTDLTLAGERVRECSAALEALERLEVGPEVAPVATIGAMEVDTELCAAKMDVGLDVEMGLPIAA